MSRKPVVLRELARRDIDDTVDHYLHEVGADIAVAFVDALEAAFAQLSDQPRSGSPRYAHELDIPGLRFLSVAGYPYLIFYVDENATIDVWRVLHGARDIPAWLLESYRD